MPAAVAEPVAATLPVPVAATVTMIEAVVEDWTAGEPVAVDRPAVRAVSAGIALAGRR